MGRFESALAAVTAKVTLTGPNKHHGKLERKVCKVWRSTRRVIRLKQIRTTPMLLFSALKANFSGF